MSLMGKLNAVLDGTSDDWAIKALARRYNSQSGQFAQGDQLAPLTRSCVLGSNPFWRDGFLLCRYFYRRTKFGWFLKN